jgi:hypothetical protein
MLVTRDDLFNYFGENLKRDKSFLLKLIEMNPKMI